MDQLILRRLDDMTAEEGPEPGAALRRLTVFRGGFTAAAAAAILGLEDDPAHLDRLLTLLRGWQFVSWQTLVNGQRRERYIVDPLVVTAVGIDDSARPAHYSYFETLARRCRDSGVYTALDIEIGNLSAAFDWALGAEIAAAYQLYSAAGDFLAQHGHADQQMDWIERLAVAVIRETDPYLRGMIQNSLGVACQNNPLGSRRDNLRRAIAAYRAALDDHDPQTALLAHAVAQHNLGTAHADLARIEDRAENLWHAVEAYQIALRYRTPEFAPLAFAATQNALGLAYRDLAGIEDRTAHLERAIHAYQNALRHYPPQAAPLEFAATQNNLGNAYCALSAAQDFADNLRRAINAYQSALEYRTPQAAPLAYAATQNNLGTVYRALATGEEPAINLRRAIAAFEEALRYYTPEQSPLDYAAAQNNLGAAYRALAGIEESAAFLRQAVTAFESALRYVTPQNAPLDYATTQANLGLARQDLGERAAAVICWREAAQYFQQMGDLDKTNLMREWITAASRVSH
ncbi:MAG: tetratricopeptide repeat protein [Chloroflexi bacterium]|nr:tetratricopeptide repeat protein [Chloroflexota bacterium]